MVDRYCAQVCDISSTKILCFPASQASNLQSIRRQISQDLVMCQAHWRFTVWKKMKLSAFQRCCRTPASSASSAWSKQLPTLLLGVLYRLAGVTTRFLQWASHAWSSWTPPLRCAPLLECTQYPYNSLIHQYSPVGTYPSRSPADPSLSSVLSVFPPIVVVFVIAFSCGSDFRTASVNGGAACRAAAAGPSFRAAFQTPPSPRLSSDHAPLCVETGHWRTRGTNSRRNGVLHSEIFIIGI